MDRKRVSDPSIAMIEDGARARVVEEAIILIAFNHAKRHAFFSSTTIPGSLLDEINDLTEGKEVHSWPKSSWETCLLRGFDIWKTLREHRGGTVVADLNTRTMEYVFEPTLLLAA